jgi:hypothetical protein
MKINTPYIFLGGLEFQILYKEIDFHYKSFHCTIDNKNIMLTLNDNELNALTQYQLNNKNINEKSNRKS